VLLLADDLGFSDPAPFGGEIATPHLSRLAEEGLRFSNYHTAASCAPTRGMLLTGVDSHRNGVPNIVEAIPPVQAKHANYSGTLGQNVVTIATLLKDAGYHTYMTGKWHLGHSPELLPIRRGFERTITMADTGADNWEQKPYLPIYAKANWFADGAELQLPDDFYSSKFFIDKTIEFIESNRGDGKPFFSYIPFQAVHIPVQAPAEFTEKYVGRYDEGWSALREERRRRAVELGLVPDDTAMVTPPTTADWTSLSAEEKRYAAKKMAVQAGMVEAMDHHIGRLLDYLRETGEYDDTVFIFLSDNGAEASDAANAGGWIFDLWLGMNGYDTDYETLGERGSFVTIGPSFASAAAAPLAYYKFFAHEGGMRVPLIVAGGGVRNPGDITNAFTYVTDIAPTILEITGVAAPAGSRGGVEFEPMVGRSLWPIADGRVQRIHPPDEAIGYELGGNAALFRGRYKVVRDRGPIGDDEWHLFDIESDPGEARDLREDRPELFSQMLEEYEQYAAGNGVLPVPDGYDQRTQVMRYGLRNRLGPRFFPGVGAVAVLVGVLIWRRAASRR
jgi:arylsulfatase A-like enzyme